MISNRVVFYVAALMSFGSACHQNDFAPESTASDTSLSLADARSGCPTRDVAEPDFCYSPLPRPSYDNNSECGDDPPPTVCEWANSVDAVVMGTVVARELVESPVYVRNDGNERLEDTCEGGRLIPGARFTIDVSEVFFGEAEPTLDLVIPGEYLSNWAGTPSVDESGSFRWDSVQLEPLQIGTTVGLAITKHAESGTWGFYGEWPFTFRPNGDTEFYQGGCFWVAPRPTPADYATLKSELSVCSAVPNDRYAWRTTGFSTDPDGIFAATCWVQTPPDPEPEFDAGAPDG